MQPILLIGPSGMLGAAWQKLLQARAADFRCTDIPQFDFTKPDSIDRVVTGGLAVVINCGAYTDVDGAEKNEALAAMLNGSGVAALARRCKHVGATLVHYSTDYVFSGQSTTPYLPDQPREPLNAYGRTKALGELAIEQSDCDYLLVRTSWLYAPWGKNFVRTIAKLCREKDQLQVVSDQRGRPTSAEHLAESTFRLLEKNARGIYHVTDGGECTWFDFASAIAKRFNVACTVRPCNSDQYPRPARRPAYSVLDLTKTEALLGPMPDWRRNLASVMDRLQD